MICGAANREAVVRQPRIAVGLARAPDHIVTAPRRQRRRPGRGGSRGRPGHGDGIGPLRRAVLGRHLDLDGVGARVQGDGAALRAAGHRGQARALADLDRGLAGGLHRRRQLDVGDAAGHRGGVGEGRLGEGRRAQRERRERPRRARRALRRQGAQVRVGGQRGPPGRAVDADQPGLGPGRPAARGVAAAARAETARVGDAPAGRGAAVLVVAGRVQDLELHVGGGGPARGAADDEVVGGVRREPGARRRREDDVGGGGGAGRDGGRHRQVGELRARVAGHVRPELRPELVGRGLGLVGARLDAGQRVAGRVAPGGERLGVPPVGPHPAPAGRGGLPDGAHQHVGGGGRGGERGEHPEQQREDGEEGGEQREAAPRGRGPARDRRSGGAAGKTARRRGQAGAALPAGGRDARAGHGLRPPQTRTQLGSRLGSRLSALGSRLSALGSRLSALGSRLSALGSRLSALGSRLSALGSRLSALGSRLSALGSRLSALGSRLSALGSRLSALGSRLSALLYYGYEMMPRPQLSSPLPMPPDKSRRLPGSANAGTPGSVCPPPPEAVSACCRHPAMVHDPQLLATLRRRDDPPGGGPR